MNLPLALVEKTAREGKIAHLFIFHGGSSQERRNAVWRLAQVLNCLELAPQGPCQQCSACRKISSGNHPDVSSLEPRKLSIGIEQVLSWQEQIYRKHYEGKYRVSLIEQADLLTIPAANALLKVVEEPPERTLFILSTQNAEGLIPTLRSRAQSVYFPEPTEQKWYASLGQTDLQEAKDAFRLSAGTPELANEILEHGVVALRAWLNKFCEAVVERDFLKLFPLFPIDKKQASLYLQIIALRGQQEISNSQEGVEAVLAVKKAIEELRQQASPRLVIEVLALELFQQGGILCDRGCGGSF